jgi:replicative DNA helicase
MQNSKRDEIMEMVDEMLDMDGPVMIGSLEFSKSQILKRLDPIAYREACIDLIDSHISDLQYDMDHSDDENEINWIQEQIDDLENF